MTGIGFSSPCEYAYSVSPYLTPYQNTAPSSVQAPVSSQEAGSPSPDYSLGDRWHQLHETIVQSTSEMEAILQEFYGTHHYPGAGERFPQMPTQAAGNIYIQFNIQIHVNGSPASAQKAEAASETASSGTAPKFKKNPILAGPSKPVTVMADDLLTEIINRLKTDENKDQLAAYGRQVQETLQKGFKQNINLGIASHLQRDPLSYALGAIEAAMNYMEKTASAAQPPEELQALESFKSDIRLLLEEFKTKDSASEAPRPLTVIDHIANYLSVTDKKQKELGDESVARVGERFKDKVEYTIQEAFKQHITLNIDPSKTKDPFEYAKAAIQAAMERVEPDFAQTLTDNEKTAFETVKTMLLDALTGPAPSGLETSLPEQTSESSYLDKIDQFFLFASGHNPSLGRIADRLRPLLAASLGSRPQSFEADQIVERTVQDFHSTLSSGDQVLLEELGDLAENYFSEEFKHRADGIDMTV